MQIKIHFDGACHNKKGQNNPMGIGLAVFINNEYSEQYSDAIHYECTGGELGTSNISEWKGCVEAFRKICRLTKIFPGTTFQVFSDSELITNQFNEKWDINRQNFRVYKKEADRFAKLGGVSNLKIIHIRREFNTHADKLSKQGLKVEI